MDVVPGLEPRMAVPETAVLPITPYPKATRNRWSRASLDPMRRGGAAPRLLVGRRADYQRFRAGFSRLRRDARRGAVAAGPQPVQAANTAEQLKGFVQRRAVRRTGDRHPDRAERLS